MVLVGEILPALRDDIVFPPLERLVPGDGLLKHSRVPSSKGNKKPAELGAGGWEAVELSLSRVSPFQPPSDNNSSPEQPRRRQSKPRGQMSGSSRASYLSS